MVNGSTKHTHSKKKSSKSTNFVFFLSFIALISFGAWYLATYILVSDNQSIELKIETIIDSFDENDPSTYQNVEKIVLLGDDAIPYFEKIINDKSIEKRWAAVVSLSGIARINPETEYRVTTALKKVLHDNNDAIKLLAAGELLSLGDKEGIPTLIELLASDSITLFIDPPNYIAFRANEYLRHGTQTDVDFDYFNTDELKQKQIESWNEWWNVNNNNLIWDKERGVFSLN